MRSGLSVPDNLAAAAQFVAAAAADGATLVVLPENFAFMGRQEVDRLAVAEAEGQGPLQDFLANTASGLGITLVGGTIPLKVAGDADRVAAASLVHGPDGKRIGRYDKIHLFDVDLPGGGGSYRESAGIRPGSEPTVAETPAGRLGVTVCYDLRFPELYRALVAHHAELLVVSAAFTVPTGEAHWHVLLRARAIENLAPLVAAAQWGEHENGRRTYGHSLIVDAWGKVLAQKAEGEGHVAADLDGAHQARLRSEFPALAHRRLGTDGQEKR